GMIGYKSVSSASIEGSDGEFAFSVEDGFNGMRIFYEARPIVETESNPSAGGADGLFLKRIDWPVRSEGGETRRLSFIPTPMLQILDFPIEPGKEIITTGHDVANKRDTGLDGAPSLSSSNNMRLSATVGNKDQFDVCEDQAQAWPVNLNLEIAGDYNLQMIGTFWMATQYGGWPIKEEYILLRDDAVTADPLITGNFSSSMMKLDPGDYI
ncbi:MAG TPA: hypothetical protein VM600_07340, partial [Actinomycetota bacterium]|nr:hypothetical protein [Actinomycetota bacterium]